MASTIPDVAPVSTSKSFAFTSVSLRVTFTLPAVSIVDALNTSDTSFKLPAIEVATVATTLAVLAAASNCFRSNAATLSSSTTTMATPKRPKVAWLANKLAA